MKISVDDVRYIAKLAKLSFSEDEARKMVEEFGDILSRFESISLLDLKDVKLDLSIDDVRPVLRKDKSFVFHNREKLFQNVKSIKDNHVAVPKIME